MHFNPFLLLIRDSLCLSHLEIRLIILKRSQTVTNFYYIKSFKRTFVSAGLSLVPVAACAEEVFGYAFVRLNDVESFDLVFSESTSLRLHRLKQVIFVFVKISGVRIGLLLLFGLCNKRAANWF
jgi:hypothetical protein